MSSVTLGYMCRTDFDWELGMAADGNKIFPSVKALKHYRKCVKGCGIVRVRVTLDKVITKGTGE